ncbi:MAG: purine-binding chemotaxis protein CheW, partial [Deltaproteobacteria bacterium]|nr:purine-binding chemotaxis protein CheW [Deltaproteobacteria bacterium]
MSDLPAVPALPGAPSPTKNDSRSASNQLKEGKYLTFELTRELYGLEILKVREIMGMMEITHVPQTPAFVKGLINLRGRVIPVVDLRLKFGLSETEYTERTTIIVVEISSESGQILIGIVVDNVSEVLHIAKQDLEITPNFGSNLQTDYI